MKSVTDEDIAKARRQIGSHARKHASLDAEDLTEDALVEAMEHYKPERGKFHTFAFLVYKRNFCTYWTKRSRISTPARCINLRPDINNLEVARLYIRDKLSLALIGRIMKCDPVTVMDRLEKMGIERRSRRRAYELTVSRKISGDCTCGAG